MFKLHHFFHHYNSAPELVHITTTTTSDKTYCEGSVLTFSSTTGALTEATGTASAMFVAAETKTVEKGKTDVVTVYKVNSDMVFETNVNAVPTSLKRGSRVTISTDGMEVTATEAKTGCGAVIYDTLGASKKGDKVLVLLAPGLYETGSSSN